MALGVGSWEIANRADSLSHILRGSRLKSMGGSPGVSPHL